MTFSPAEVARIRREAVEAVRAELPALVRRQMLRRVSRSHRRGS